MHTWFAYMPHTKYTDIDWSQKGSVVSDLCLFCPLLFMNKSTGTTYKYF